MRTHLPAERPCTRPTLPNRIIRDSCKTSHSLEKLSSEAERLFWRLVTVADDFGRFEADPVLLLAKCFPLKVQEYKLKDVAKWYAELEACEHVQTYVSNCYHYGFFTSWDKHQVTRAKASKYPDPVPANICSHLPTYVSVNEKRETRNEVEKDSHQNPLGLDVPISLNGKGEHAAAVIRVWEYYLGKFDKNPKLLTFSPLRKQKGLARMDCALKKTGGDCERAEGLMRLAVDAMAQSEFHRAGGYTSWEKHLFPSDEKFEIWLEKSK